MKIIDPEDPEHKKVIEKKIYHEDYVGEDRWRGMGFWYSSGAKLANVLQTWSKQRSAKWLNGAD